MSQRAVDVAPGVRIGEGSPLVVIAGPCQIESRDHALFMAQALSQLGRTLPIKIIYKSSYDKANRTSLSGARGIGIEEGLRILEEVRSTTGMPVITDVHSVEQAMLASEVVDVLQIPAFLCRQTDLLLAAGRTGRAVNIKKGQFLPASDMAFAVEKVTSTGNHRVMCCERGSCFGYRDLIVDMRGLVIMRELGYPVIFDATHSVQSMGGGHGSSSGAREYVAPLIRAASAVGVDGLFIECHEEPSRAPSDSATMIPLSEMEDLLRVACSIREAAAPDSPKFHAPHP
jgi:2-dehydro-3-deoxyphosphooctonate aldolase (KDO 8-P synthase)